jgi:pyrroline-5-carboxylate reductase
MSGNAERTETREAGTIRRVQVVKDAQAVILAAWPEIVNGLVNKAKEGSYQHAKFLSEFAGLELPAEDEGPAVDTEEFARAVMRELLGEEPPE